MMPLVRLFTLLGALLLASAAFGEEPAYRNTLRWSTASEVENLGFDIYRAEQADGPFIRINERPVAGAGTSDEPQQYEYIDATIDPARRYFYYVESIALDGSREKFTPTYEVPPKRAAAGN